METMPLQNGFEIPDGMSTRAAQITNGFLLDGGGIDGGEIA